MQTNCIFSGWENTCLPIKQLWHVNSFWGNKCDTSDKTWLFFPTSLYIILHCFCFWYQEVSGYKNPHNPLGAKYEAPPLEVWPPWLCYILSCTLRFICAIKCFRWLKLLLKPGDPEQASSATISRTESYIVIESANVCLYQWLCQS